MNFIVLCSSRGTTFQAVIDRLADGSLTANCLGLVVDREDRGAVEKAKKANLPIKVVGRIKGEPREEYDWRLNEAINEMGEVDVIAALGWMFILNPWFVQNWEGRIVNVHPALLPKHPGAHGIEDALGAGDKETGMTIHIIDEGVDTGPILVQKSCSINPGETVDSLKPRIQDLEKEWYPKTLQMIETGEIQLKTKTPA
ncbi:MAG: phosphoribosylglycinamide formyltransferase [Candidatus Peribacteraceae bacterium]|jgi:formyltetrahydrofolate-dependent phosphoribosylglycinamide formyltransferase|nr:phosphoribosylglycinamide formyltransferase [Parcubacteria group bacterium]MDP6575669.1 phosphoribosylglycinamide formyltransferase [Candidatus Peribacteraceae bacterium]HCI03354.1 phosphoribosylglycinamide formyltransferase [Candidatus Peribacteria bacterium]|tara:strand:+ start:8823 stop:9419 length:597 start_codon:yes stop_codon:yes gene_type:complete